MSKAINIRNQAAAPQGDVAYEFDMQQFGTGEHFTAFGPDAYEWTGQTDTNVDIATLLAAQQLSITKGIHLNADGLVDGYSDTEVAVRPSATLIKGRIHYLCAGAGSCRIELWYNKSASRIRLIQAVIGSQLVTK